MGNFPYIDLIIAIALIIYVLIGAKDGFLKSFVGLGGIVISIVVAFLLCEHVVNGLDSLFQIRSGTASLFESFFLNKSPAEGSLNYFATQVTNKEMAVPAVQESLRSLNLPGFLYNLLENSALGSLDGMDYSQNVTTASIVAPVVANLILSVVAAVVLFVVFKILFSLVTRRLMRLKQIKGVDAVDKVAGISVGLVKVVVMAFVFMTLLTFFAPVQNFISEAIDNSIIGKFIYDNNPFLGLVINYF